MRVIFLRTSMFPPAMLLGLALLLAMSPAASAQSKRVALVIGNAAYVHTPRLANSRNDAADVSATLRSVGFQVIEGLDLDKAAFERRVREFAVALGRAEAGVFFYAGHGLQVAGQNYLVPIDAELTAASALEFEMVRLDIVQRVDGAGGTDQHPLPRRLPRQPARPQSRPRDGDAVGRDRPRARRRRVGCRHADQLLDAARQRRARRPGPQLAVRRRPRSPPRCRRRSRCPAHRGAQRCDERDAERSRCRGSTRR